MNELMAKLIADAGGSLVIQLGKCVVEAKPANFDKGTAIEEFLLEAPFKDRKPVFIGDDLNDEHGFAVINKLGGISIKVGAGDSCAAYRLPGVDAVRTWLASALAA
jgi:trehalose 6-phosphate phosphatase